jgi:hypothetical protein
MMICWMLWYDDLCYVSDLIGFDIGTTVRYFTCFAGWANKSNFVIFFSVHVVIAAIPRHPF